MHIGESVLPVFILFLVNKHHVFVIVFGDFDANDGMHCGESVHPCIFLFSIQIFIGICINFITISYVDGKFVTNRGILHRNVGKVEEADTHLLITYEIQCTPAWAQAEDRKECKDGSNKFPNSHK